MSDVLPRGSDLREWLTKDANPITAAVCCARAGSSTDSWVFMRSWLGERDAIVGRTNELRMLDEACRRAVAGGAQVVELVGPAGIGKSAILQAWTSSLDGWTVGSAVADDAETAVSFGVVDQLLRALGGGTTAIGSAAELDATTVGARLMAALECPPGSSGVVVIVDDAQWADTSSLHALGFALRRVPHDPVVLVLALRDAETPRNAAVGRLVASLKASTVQVRGLGVDETAELLGALGSGPTDRRAIERLVDHTGGNPLHIRALVSEFSAAAFESDRYPLPAPAMYAALVVERLEKCSAPTRAAVAAAAVLGQRSAVATLTQVGELDDAPAAIDEAVDAGLLVLLPPDARAVRFVHPMARAAVYYHLGLEQRVALHQRAAAVADDPLAALRHRLAAVVDTAAELADEMARAALAEGANGRWYAAVELLTGAAEICGDQQHRFRLQLNAIDALIAAGEVAEAIGRWEQLMPPAVPDALWLFVSGRIALCAGQAAHARQQFARSYRLCRRSQADLAARVSSQLAVLRLNDGRWKSAARWASRSTNGVPIGDPAAAFARGSLAFALAGLGRRDEAVRLIEESIAAGRSPSIDDQIGLGVAELWSGDAARASAHLLPASSSANASVYERILSLLYLADAEYRLGRWDNAITYGQLGVSLAEDADHWLLPLLHSTAALPLAGRGDWASADVHLRAARRLSGLSLPPTVWTAAAEARVAHARGDHQLVLTALAPLRPVLHLDGVQGLGVQPWQPLAVEALTMLHRPDEAKYVLAALEASLAGTGYRRGQVVLARLRSMIAYASGDPEAASGALAAVLEDEPDRDGPFERGLTEMWLGGVERRGRQRSRARDLLISAREQFSKLAARPYLDRCERELAACGLTVSRRIDRDRAALTPQEVSVANLAAAGLTNREIAAELVVSVKTVEFHLGNVFRKLDVSSRARLARDWSARSAP